MDSQELIRQRHTAAALKYLCSPYVDGLIEAYLATAEALQAATKQSQYDALGLLTRQGNRQWRHLIRASGAIIA